MNRFQSLRDAIFYYQMRGFIYIDLPWVGVDSQPFKSPDHSLLHMISEGKVKKSGKYVTCIPCVSHDRIDDLNRPTYWSVELFITDNPSDSELESVVNLCYDFFSRYLPVTINPIDDGFKITSNQSDIHLGSYRFFKSNEKFQWIRATGCSEPRLSYVLHKENINLSPKDPSGSYYEILNQVERFKQSLLSQNRIQSLVDLSNLYGSISEYLEVNYKNVDMSDLSKMCGLT